MIREVSGDILLSNADTIAHGVAPNDHFDQGLALSLRQKFPEMYRDFRHGMHVAHTKEGGLVTWTGDDAPRIAHLLTQEHAKSANAHPGKARLSYVNKALRELRRWADSESVASLALPRLATGVGGLDWDDVRPLIQQHLGDAGFDVFVYSEFHAGERADEN